MNWQNCLLGDFLTLKRGHDLPSHVRQQGSIPVVSSAGITGYHSEAKACAPGVVTGRYGTLGEVFFLEEDYWPLNTALYVVDFKGNDPRFTSYFLKNILKDYQSDKAAIPGVDRNVLHALQIKAPDADTQIRISHALSSYDDLIENNRRRIKLLEESARLLYREWFVYLRFPGHEHVVITNGVPEGWEQTSLGQYSKLNYGKALKAENRVEGDFAVYGSSGVVGSHNAALVKGPAIIVGRKGNVGSVYWSSRDCWPIDTVYFIAPDKANLYLYYALQFMQFINTDVAVPGLNRDLAHSRPLMIPSPRILSEFLLTAAPIRQQIEKLEELNQKLAQARDLLLPRLMNGEITV